MTTPNIYDLFVQGQRSLQSKAADVEAGKVGILRAGNTGMLTPEGEVIGPCMAATHLRFIGLDVKGLEDDGDSGGAPGRELMFEAGRTNEDSWYDVLKQSWTSGPILREEEVATHWKTESGISVTGRPDLVLCSSTASRGRTSVEPQIGIELKNVSSFWTAYEVKFKGQPKYNHLLQAAHYSWQLGIPFELWYTSRVDYHLPGWIASQLPRPGERNSEYLAYSYYRLKGDKSRSKVSKLEFEKLESNGRQADPLKVLPFIQGYAIQLFDGVLKYRPVGTDKWIETDITVDKIQMYYNIVSQLDVVPPEPRVLKADGTKANYKARDYCALGPLCCAYNEGRNMNEWIAEIKQELTRE